MLVPVGLLFVGGRSMVSSGGLNDAVVKADGRTVTSSQFRSLFERYRTQLAQQQQQQAPGSPPAAPISVEDAVKQGLDTRALDEIAYEEALAALIAREGVRPSDTLITAELRKAPTLFDPLTGKFDKTAYERFLAQNNLTAAAFESNIRDQIAQQHMFAGLVGGVTAPASFGALQAAFNHEGRRFEALTFGPSAVPTPQPPSDAELRAFMRENAKALTRPETRQVTLVRFSASLLASTVSVTDADLQKRFALEKDSLSKPETRTIVQIPLKAAGQAPQVVAGLRAGREPAAVAHAVGAQPVMYADAPRTAVPDAKLAAEAFSMAAGEVRGPVTGGLGLAVLQIVKVVPGHVATLEDARAQLETEARRYAAGQKANALVQKFEDARGGGATLVEAAKTAGVAAVAVPAFDAQGRGPGGRPLPVPRKLVETAFALAIGGDSPILEAGQGQSEFYAIHLDRSNPPGMLTLDEIRAPLTQRLMLQATGKALKAKADLAADQVRGGRQLRDFATGAGASLVTTEVRRDDPQAAQTYSNTLLGEVFEAKPGAVVVGAAKDGVAVLRVLGPLETDPAELARLSTAARTGATSGLQEDIAVRAREAARSIVKPTLDPKRARRALGVDTPTPAKT